MARGGRRGGVLSFVYPSLNCDSLQPCPTMAAPLKLICPARVGCGHFWVPQCRCMRSCESTRVFRGGLSRSVISDTRARTGSRENLGCTREPRQTGRECPRVMRDDRPPCLVNDIGIGGRRRRRRDSDVDGDGEGGRSEDEADRRKGPLSICEPPWPALSGPATNLGDCFEREARYFVLWFESTKLR